MKGPYRFTRKERINAPQDFRRVMKSGKRHSSQNFILFSLKTGNSYHRLGIVIKKEIGLATYRIKMKRLLREFFRLHKDQLKGSFDNVLFVKKGCRIKRYPDAEQELRKLFAL